jgi:NitT/TauT family transport system ATP-binding protein
MAFGRIVANRNTASMAADSLVLLKAIGMRFSGGIEALKGLDLDVREGEFLSLLGPSGCGKTTVLRLLAGLARPSAGLIDGPAAPGRPHRGRGEVGYVFQDPTLMPWASVADNVWLPLRLQGVSRQDAAQSVAAMLALVGLTEFATAYPRELSGGMRMRVSIARSLVTRPRLLLMDEPFAALDEITRFKLNDDLLRLKDELACTIVFVTHSIYESAYLSDRIAVMTPRPGRVLDLIAADLPAPRTEALRRDARYIALCGTLSEALARSLALAV